MSGAPGRRELRACSIRIIVTELVQASGVWQPTYGVDRALRRLEAGREVAAALCPNSRRPEKRHRNSRKIVALHLVNSTNAKPPFLRNVTTETSESPLRPMGGR